MKRVLTLLAVVFGFLAVSACDYDLDISVDASAELTYYNGDDIRIAPVTYEGFHSSWLSNSDLERIFVDLTRNVNPDFATAYLDLDIFNDITGTPIRSESYGVVYNSYSGHYEFAELK